MPRIRPRKTDKGLFSEETLQMAVKLVIEENYSVRAAAAKCGLARTTLDRYVKQARSHGQAIPVENIRKMTYTTMQVFTADEEQRLVEFIITCSKLHHGLTRNMVRSLAYEFALKNSKIYPTSWDENKQAGVAWLYGLMGRNQQLTTLWLSRPTRLARSQSFDPGKAGEFFNSYRELMERYQFKPRAIWNLGEVAVKAFQDPVGMLSGKGLSHLPHGDRGEVVTMCACVSAIGQSIPPVFVFPRAQFKTSMMKGAPTGSLGLADRSGKMTKGVFVSALKHFISHMNISPENRGLLVMDHAAHVNVEGIDLAGAHGLNILTFPPHCTNKMQPLDLSVYGPFKRYYNDLCNRFILSNKGCPMTIYDVAEQSGFSYDQSFTLANIKSGFRSSGLFPINYEILIEEDFLSSSVMQGKYDIRSDIPPTCDRSHSPEPVKPCPHNPEQVKPCPESTSPPQTGLSQEEPGLA